MRRFGFNRVLITRMKKVNKKRTKYCMFFCRYGRCLNSKCPYVHDVDKVAVCTRFVCKLRHVFVRRTKANASKNESVLGKNSTISERKKLFKKRSVKKQPPSKEKIAENECENNSENSAKFQGFIPLVKDTRVVDSDDVYFADDCDEFLPSKEWSTLDYDSDDTWIDEEECQNENQAKKPSIRIIPHFLMGTSV
ncbi:zinc finger CCCH domain-containing protein 3-like protein [Dinothrombium tinctorium]|uniref:Zinc finger CCCH domain-containing protein 3-like protein n=1 Tax=Dinothrombium tinctorium TaxID=1965070 RepID=A0A443R7S4_9ACAR|nr:zinc finger CCCH domain-containing protein 3-like protein [Dinothrombium tinctorium]